MPEQRGKIVSTGFINKIKRKTKLTFLRASRSEFIPYGGYPQLTHPHLACIRSVAFLVDQNFIDNTRVRCRHGNALLKGYAFVLHFAVTASFLLQQDIAFFNFAVNERKIFVRLIGVQCIFECLELRASHKSPVNRVPVHDDAVFLIVLPAHDSNNCVATRREFFLVRALHFGGHQWFLSVMQNVVRRVKAVEEMQQSSHFVLVSTLHSGMYFEEPGCGQSTELLRRSNPA